MKSEHSHNAAHKGRRWFMPLPKGAEVGLESPTHIASGRAGERALLEASAGEQRLADAPPATKLPPRERQLQSGPHTGVFLSNS